MTEAGASCVVSSFCVNGYTRKVQHPTNTLLSELIREVFNIRSLKVGCDQGICGACTVLVDGRLSIACSTFAFEADGSTVTTVEGLEETLELKAAREAFIAGDAIQCGYCTPGLLVSTVMLLRSSSVLTTADIRRWLSAHVCRCTGYEMIIEAVQAASISLRSLREASR